ncbi:MAG TPA: UDP-N-acetylglucosamine--N-acetylmuramyl-(pentapeptide) pyrophosphoryl-undecaprenol N-acetylglucosamine transferase [Actinomycetaceae bacterium]|nr:UDP-N-acetylglucosamine--N-acetylmuramyl-(pentapeptide) pyrophosphoryl-undecaprenol N-acetylglucosamine transferase [Actinomycetaceae bacterium]
MAELSFLLAGGGSAGHVNPLLATAAELRRRHPEARIEAVGTETGLEADLVPAAGFKLNTIPRVRIPRRPSSELLTLPGRLRSALAKARELMDEIKPSVVIGYGGDLSFPAYRAAFAAGIPVVVHEQNARPGLANRYAARRAAVVAVTFASTPLEAKRGRRVITGLPLRAPVAALSARRAAGEAGRARAEAATELGLEEDRATLLVTGGSLGAVSINLAAAGAAASLTDYQVLHLTGRGKDRDVSEILGAAGKPRHYHVREYLSDMHLAYAVTDLALTRAGAGMVSELAALGIPAVYVPLPVGNGEQRLNAQEVVAVGGGILLDDADLTPEWVAQSIVPLLADRDTLAEMGRRAAGAGPADGASRLADEIETLT